MSTELAMEFTVLSPGMPAPAYAYQGDAGLDLRAAEDAVILPGDRATIGCGIAVAIPPGYAGFVIPRSGLASKQGISIVNAPGLIDSGYRGEIKVCLINTDKSNTFTVRRNDRIAQLVIMAVPTMHLIPVDHLDETERAAGGFGSSGTE